MIHGRGGHASAPHDCLDPIPIACEIVQALQTFVTRRVDVFDPAVITIAKIEAGSTRNVIPETARMLGTIRTVSERTRERVLEGVERLVKGLAAAHGAEAEVKLIRGYPVTVNDEGITGFAAHVAAELLGEQRVRLMPTPMMGSEDFSYVLRRVPGTLMFLGTRPDGDAPAIPNHSNRMVRQRDGHGHRRRAPRGGSPALPRRQALHVRAAAAQNVHSWTPSHTSSRHREGESQGGVAWPEQSALPQNLYGESREVPECPSGSKSHTTQTMFRESHETTAVLGESPSGRRPREGKRRKRSGLASPPRRDGWRSLRRG